ncbi:MAG: AAA family ATPase [Bryobacterales bacterium]|nr:AAA family ATPase [Bryobacterales bacterium]
MRPKICVLVGLPGSGKSWWVEQNRLPALSSDLVRHLLSDTEEIQSINRLVFATMRYLVKQRIKAGAAVTYIDSTALSLWERRCWVRLAQGSDCGIEAIFFETPLEICLERNSRRSRVVPPEVIQTMARRLVPPTEAEGFQKVTIIRPA